MRAESVGINDTDVQLTECTHTHAHACTQGHTTDTAKLKDVVCLSICMYVCKLRSPGEKEVLIEM